MESNLSATFMMLSKDWGLSRWLPKYCAMVLASILLFEEDWLTLKKSVWENKSIKFHNASSLVCGSTKT